jgi:sugar-specific transcriptional regulator TrmB
MQKGLVNKYTKSSQTYFSALDPNRLLAYIDREIEETARELTKQRTDIEKLLPEIKSLQHKIEQPKVQFFEGEKGMREAYEDTLTAKDGIVAYANVQTMHEGLPNFFPTYYDRRAKALVYIRAIMPQNNQSFERTRNDQKEMRDSRFLPQNQSFTPEMNIYNNKVLIASWKEKMAVIIESKELADLQRVIFENLWNTLPRTKSLSRS